MKNTMELATRSLSPLESRIVLDLVERDTREITRQDLIRILETSPKGADKIIRSLRQKGWLERAGWGKYLLIPPDQGPDVLGENNVLALASQIADPYYFGYGTAASHYGMTTQHRAVIWLVTPRHIRDRRLLNTEVRIVNPSEKKFFGFGSVNVLAYEVMMSDREKTAIDCIDRPELSGGVGEVAYILARACRKLDWNKAVGYLQQINSIALARKFGWLVDHVGGDIPKATRSTLMELAFKSDTKAILGPKASSKEVLGYQGNWKLTVNVTRSDLHESAGLARHRVLKRGH